MLANKFCDFKSCLMFLVVALILNSNVQLVGSETVCGAVTLTYFQSEDDTGFELCFSPAIELTSYKWVHFSLEVTPDFAFSKVYANVPTVVIKPLLESDEGYYNIDCLDALGRQFFSNSVVVQKPYVLPTTMATRTININVTSAPPNESTTSATRTINVNLTSAPPNVSTDTADAGNYSVTGANFVTTADDKFEITVTSATTTEEEVPEVIDSSTIEVGANRRTDSRQSCSFVTLVKEQNAGDNTYICTLDGVATGSAHTTLQSFASVKPKTRKRYENVFPIYDEADAREDGEQEAKIENEYCHLSIDVTEAAYVCIPDTYEEVPGETTNHPPIMHRSNVESCLDDAANEDRKGIPANYSEMEPAIELYESLQGRSDENEYAGTIRVYENLFLYKDN